MLDNQLGIEALFTIVLMTYYSNKEYKFVTQTDGKIGKQYQAYRQIGEECQPIWSDLVKEHYTDEYRNSQHQMDPFSKKSTPNQKSFVKGGFFQELRII